MSHPMKVVMVFLQQFHQISRSTRFKPITPKLIPIKSMKQAERIVHSLRIVRKMITIIHLFQPDTYLLIRHFLHIGKLMKLGIQIIV